MLRSLVLAFGVGLTLAGFVLAALGAAFWISPLSIGMLILVGSVFERVRYKRLTTNTRGLTRTRERFRDPQTGSVITVYVDPATSERSYVRETPPARL